jgi:hypothetical protein
MGRPKPSNIPAFRSDERSEVGAIAVERRGSAVRLRLEGEFDLGSLDVTESTIAQVLDPSLPITSLVIDLCNVAFLDAVNARALARLAARVVGTRVIPPSGAARGILRFFPEFERTLSNG